jgi:small subunit ribosomal protein S4e
MSKNHLKRLNAPKSWPLKRRKGVTFITKSLPGPHSLKKSMPIVIIIKDILGYAKTTKEVKTILNDGKILINNFIRKDHKFPVGFMDTISIPISNEYYRLLYDEKGKFILKSIKEKEALIKLCKIKNKIILKGKKIQLNLYDGANILIPKDDYKVGDSLILENNKIKKHLKLEKNALIFLTDGKHIGNIGILETIHEPSALTQTKISFKLKNKKFETLKKYAYVIDKEIIR